MPQLTQSSTIKRHQSNIDFSLFEGRWKFRYIYNYILSIHNADDSIHIELLNADECISCNVNLIFTSPYYLEIWVESPLIEMAIKILPDNGHGLGLECCDSVYYEHNSIIKRPCGFSKKSYRLHDVPFMKEYSGMWISADGFQFIYILYKKNYIDIALWGEDESGNPEYKKIKEIISANPFGLTYTSGEEDGEEKVITLALSSGKMCMLFSSIVVGEKIKKTSN